MQAAALPDSATLARLLSSVDPRLRPGRAYDLTGGVSSQVSCIEATRQDGSRDWLVLRQYGAASLRSDPLAASHEYGLLTRLHAAGFPVPRPRHVDESCSILPVPCLVTGFIDGMAITAPAQLPVPLADFAGQLAAAQARLHLAAFTRSDLPWLGSLSEIATRTVETWPTTTDAALDEPAVRAALTRIWPPPQVNRPVLLHGDYWPGNTLWRRGVLVGIIDWEDAVLGDPLADVANSRMELTMLFGAAMAAEFTRRYCAAAPGLDFAALPRWDLYAALRHAGRMTGWGMSPDSLSRLRAGHRQFTQAALAQASRALPRSPRPP